MLWSELKIYFRSLFLRYVLTIWLKKIIPKDAQCSDTDSWAHVFFFVRFLVFELWLILYSTFVVNWGDKYFCKPDSETLYNQWRPITSWLGRLKQKASEAWEWSPRWRARGARPPTKWWGLGEPCTPNIKKFWIHLSLACTTNVKYKIDQKLKT